jgi:hypothetical protein
LGATFESLGGAGGIDGVSAAGLFTAGSVASTCAGGTGAGATEGAETAGTGAARGIPAATPRSS